ncbi:uncharacterized protein V6R79_017742 [Siganus canaliculatus]
MPPPSAMPPPARILNHGNDLLLLPYCSGFFTFIKETSSKTISVQRNLCLHDPGSAHFLELELPLGKRKVVGNNSEQLRRDQPREREHTFSRSSPSQACDYLHSASLAPPLHILIRPLGFIHKASRRDGLLRNERAFGQVEQSSGDDCGKCERTHTLRFNRRYRHRNHQTAGERECCRSQVNQGLQEFKTKVIHTTLPNTTHETQNICSVLTLDTLKMTGRIHRTPDVQCFTINQTLAAVFSLKFQNCTTDPVCYTLLVERPVPESVRLSVMSCCFSFRSFSRESLLHSQTNGDTSTHYSI